MTTTNKDMVPPLPRPYVPSDSENPHDYYTADQMHEYAAISLLASATSAPDQTEPAAWLISYESTTGPREVVHGHNAIADYRQIDPKATVTLLCRLTDQSVGAGKVMQPLSDAQIDAVMNEMPNGTLGFMKSWGYRQFARSILELRAMPVWEPEFLCNSVEQEDLANAFCLEITGKRGQKGSPPDPVRLLEMAEALYRAERKVAPIGTTPQPAGDK